MPHRRSAVGAAWTFPTRTLRSSRASSSACCNWRRISCWKRSTSQSEYAFAVHDALANLPAPAPPAHLIVMKHVSQWFNLQLITAEMKKALLQLITAEMKNTFNS